MNDVEQRLVEIEAQLAFQDDLLESLNRIVAIQQQELDFLKRRHRELLEQLRNLPDQPRRPEDETPPHY